MNHDFLHTFLFQDKIESIFKYGGRAGYILLQIFFRDNIVRQSNIQLTGYSYRRNSVKTRLRCSLLNCAYTL